MLKKLSLIAAALTVILVGAVPAAHADYAVQVYDDGVLQGGIGVVVVGNSLVFTGSTTHFSITNGSGLSNNPGTQGGSTLALSSNEQINATFGLTGGTHALQIVLSQTNWLAPAGSPLTLSSSAGGSFVYVQGTNPTASESVSATYQGFLDNTNILFGQSSSTPIQTASASATAIGTIPLVFGPGTSVSSVAGGTPFSLTDVLNFTFTLGAGSGQTTANISASTVASNVPEPASMALFGSGLFGLAGLIRRRK